MTARPADASIGNFGQAAGAPEASQGTRASPTARSLLGPPLQPKGQAKRTAGKQAPTRGFTFGLPVPPSSPTVPGKGYSAAATAIKSTTQKVRLAGRQASKQGGKQQTPKSLPD